MRSPFLQVKPKFRRLHFGFLCLLCAGLFTGISVPSWAHRGHATWTDIVWAGDRFEITHRIHLADAISILRAEGASANVDAIENLARLALYTEAHFQILGDDGETPVSLTTIGAEIENDFLFVYQEWPVAFPDSFPPIKSRILTDVEAGSETFIQIDGPGITETRHFNH